VFVIIAYIAKIVENGTHDATGEGTDGGFGRENRTVGDYLQLSPYLLTIHPALCGSLGRPEEAFSRALYLPYLVVGGVFNVC
jgi:hypothetical protein